MAKFRILSLDGGGTWALIQARALLDMFGDLPGHELLGQFSFCAANSGGSIVLASLIENMRLSKIVDHFKTLSERQKIFSVLSLLEKGAFPLYEPLAKGPRYSAERKLAGLREVLPTSGQMQLAAARDSIVNAANGKPHFLITSFDYDRLRSIYFRSDTSSRTSSSPGSPSTTLAEAVHAASNAPIRYFDAPATVRVDRGPSLNCWDGAMAGLNNPLMAAIIEVLGNNYNDVGGIKAPIEVLSIGTGTVRLPIQDGTIDRDLARAPLVDASLPHNLEVVSGIILDDPPDAATFEAHVVLGGGLDSSPSQGNLPVVRLNPVVQPIHVGTNWKTPTILTGNDPENTFGYNNTDAFAGLVNLELDALDPKPVTLIQLLATAWMRGDVPNQPIRADALFGCQIGFPTYSDGKEAWATKLSEDGQVVHLP